MENETISITADNGYKLELPVNTRRLSFLQDTRGDNYAHFSDAAMKGVAKLTNLRELYLQGTKVTYEGLRELKDSNHKNLLILSVEGMNFDETPDSYGKWVAALADLLARNPNLRILNGPIIGPDDLNEAGKRNRTEIGKAHFSKPQHQLALREIEEETYGKLADIPELKKDNRLLNLVMGVLHEGLTQQSKKEIHTL